jgi:GAF domain-containing protein
MMENRPDVAAYLLRLQQTAHALSGVLEESEVIQIMLQQTVAALEAQGAVVRLLSPEEDELIPAGSWGLRDHFFLSGHVDAADNPLARRVLNGEVVVVPDVTHDPNYPHPEVADGEGLRGLIGVPMRVRSRVLGVLCVYHTEADELGEQELLLVSALADLGALALEKVYLHQSLLRIAAALNSTLELGSMLQQVLQATIDEMRLKAATIRLLDTKRQTLRLVAAQGLGQGYLEKGEVHVAKSPVDQRVLQGEPIELYSVEHEAGFEYPQEALREGIRSVLVVPLKFKERTLGVMRVYSARSRNFSPASIQFLSSVAGLVALAIENAELYSALKEHFEDLKLDLAEWHRFLALG